MGFSGGFNALRAEDAGCFAGFNALPAEGAGYFAGFNALPADPGLRIAPEDGSKAVRGSRFGAGFATLPGAEMPAPSRRDLPTIEDRDFARIGSEPQDEDLPATCGPRLAAAALGEGRRVVSLVEEDQRPLVEAETLEVAPELTQPFQGRVGPPLARQAQAQAQVPGPAQVPHTPVTLAPVTGIFEVAAGATFILESTTVTGGSRTAQGKKR